MTAITPAVGKAPAIALYNPKYGHNVGGAVRAASCFDFPQVWFSGDRVSLQGKSGRQVRKTSRSLSVKPRLPREERMRGYQHVELCQGDYFFDAFGPGVTPVAVELVPGAEMLPFFEHPESPLYVFGPEDGSLPRSVLGQCHRFVQIPSRHCTNLAAAVYLTLYDRHAKRIALGLDEPLQLREEPIPKWPEPGTTTHEVPVYER